MGRSSKRAMDQRKRPWLSVPRGAVPEARRTTVGTAVLRGTRMLWLVHRRPALARPLRRLRRRRPLLLLRRRFCFRLARSHADVHRRLAHRGRIRTPSVGGSCNRSTSPATNLGRPCGIRGTRARDLRALYRPRHPRLRRRDRCRRVAARSSTPAPPHAGLVARLGRSLRRGRGCLRQLRVWRPAEKRIPARRGHVQPRRNRAEPPAHARRT